MPDIVNPIGGAADQKRLQIFLNRRDNQIRALRKSGAPVAVQTILVRSNLHHHQPQPLRRSRDNANVFDARNSQPTRSALYLSRSSQPLRRSRDNANVFDARTSHPTRSALSLSLRRQFSECEKAARRLQQIAALHRFGSRSPSSTIR